ncbi:PhoU domain-containing protein [Nocardia jiangsuensis]|uniref:PhoU domain-containing protein n=1 Tax=Nocardia jiangsuensis TaxID=1691563 RepID=A0ABV8DNY6_9NOCA
MSSRFHADLDELMAVLERMCRWNEAAIGAATAAVLDVDLERANQALESCAEAWAGAERAELAAAALLESVPATTGLECVQTGLQISVTLSRMAGTCAVLAQFARTRYPVRVVPASLHQLVLGMGSSAVSMAAITVHVLGAGDFESAAELDDRDDVMDRAHRELLAYAADRSGAAAVAVDLLLLGRCYRRFAEHARQVGHHTLFMVTGLTAAEGLRASPRETRLRRSAQLPLGWCYRVDRRR